jgi:hypothetical protein
MVDVVIFQPDGGDEALSGASLEAMQLTIH